MTEPSPAAAIALCRAAHERIIATAASIDDEIARRPSRLPNWTVGHVLTHVARNADGHTRRLEGALRGEDVPRYPGGSARRDRDIEEGSRRPAAELLADVTESAKRLEEAWDSSAQAGWPHPELRGADHWPTSGSPLRRLREVEVHHVDLGLGYEPADWSDEYVAWELPRALEQLSHRVSQPDARRLLAWLIGRAGLPHDLTLGSWM